MHVELEIEQKSCLIAKTLQSYFARIISNFGCENFWTDGHLEVFELQSSFGCSHTEGQKYSQGDLHTRWNLERLRTHGIAVRHLGGKYGGGIMANRG